ncbi:MAG TPA: dihydrolipoyl dehydrogenase [Candidatus Fimadaptatus faecigallinarum]|uniref:Dihydrolipoyl dehydrogenase n=1 Tax=Candidatus Fimadaptatus faecigallinarum TaxID=2840814 RepID=A0A9D1LQS8_9FIRM|nr:dihydrolipoyl dehydrogenase [Candidatus Fimadaptatus faecigallinarum]
MQDLIILGGGPAGYLAAERAAHRGMKVTLFEMRELGGVCLNEGCIPSKALLNSAKVYEHAKNGRKFGVLTQDITLDHKLVEQRRAKVVRTLVAGVKAKMKSGGIEVIKDKGTIAGRVDGGFAVEGGGQRVEAKRLLIATGSSPVTPPIPGLKEALESGFALTNREVLELKEVPKELVIIGGGVIGLEMAAYYNVAGSHVTVVEMLDHIAGPTDREISELLKKSCADAGIDFQLGARVTALTQDSVKAELDGAEREYKADKVLLSIGRRANLTGYGLETLGVETSRTGIVTDDHLRTNVEGVYAAGDVNGRIMLAHTAYRESEVAINTMLGERDVMRYNAIPSVIYTLPEVASVGMTEEEAKSRGIEYDVKKLSMRYSGRFVAENEGDGLCKILVDKQRRTVLGVHMLGTYSSEIIWGAAQLIETELTVSDAREIVFPHPTVSEIIREVLWEFDD